MTSKITVSGYEITSREVKIQVQPLEVLKDLARIVCKAYGFTTDSFINAGRIIRHEEQYAGSHSYETTVVVVENPTEEQLHALKTCRDFSLLLKDALNNGA